MKLARTCRRGPFGRGEDIGLMNVKVGYATAERHARMERNEALLEVIFFNDVRESQLATRMDLARHRRIVWLGRHATACDKHITIAGKWLHRSCARNAVP